MNNFIVPILMGMGFCVQASGQDLKLNVGEFFQQRLAASPDTPVPSYEPLLRVTDKIAGSSPTELAASLPILSAALKRDENDIAIQSLFALAVISRRPDGGVLLRSRVPEIGALLDRTEERMCAGAALVLRNLTTSNADLTVPLMLKHLTGPVKPSLVKVEIISILLDLRRNDPEVLKAVDNFINVPSQPEVQIAALRMLSSRQFRTPKFNEFALTSLGHSNKHVKIAAIYAVHALGQGSDAWGRAQSILTLMSVNQNQDPELRVLAEKALKNTLMNAQKQ